MIPLPLARLPAGPARIAERFRRNMLACFMPGVGVLDIAGLDGAAYSQSGSFETTPGHLGVGRLVASNTFIVRSRAVAHAATTNYTMLVAVSNVSFAIGNPGVWRNGNEFCAFQGTTGRPRLRSNGVDVLIPASGYGITAGAAHTFIFRFRTGVDASFFADGALRHHATHAQNNAAFSFTDIGYQNAATESLGGKYAAWVFWKEALSDGECNLLTGNPANLLEPISIPTWIAAAVGGASNGPLIGAGRLMGSILRGGRLAA